VGKGELRTENEGRKWRVGKSVRTEMVGMAM